MKRIFVSLSIMLSFGLTTVFANGKTGINDKIKESFKNQYAGAESVKWSTLGDYQAATFGFHNHLVVAYYSQDGTLLGSARDVLYDEMPLAVSTAFDTRFAGADIMQIHEINNIEGTCYWLTIESQNKKYHVKVGSSGGILEVVKIKR